MPDDVEYIAKCEDELWQIIDKMHKRVRFEVIHSIMQEMVKTLELQGYSENWLSTYSNK